MEIPFAENGKKRRKKAEEKPHKFLANQRTSKKHCCQTFQVKEFTIHNESSLERIL